MPYIKKNERNKYDDLISNVFSEVQANGAKAGDINYIFSSIIWRLFELNKCYDNANKLMGVLSCIQSEFYRRKIVSYELEKIIENGDIQ